MRRRARGLRPGTAGALAVPLVTLMLVSSGCTSAGEKGEETVYEIVDPPSTTPVAPSTTRPVPEPNAAPVVTQPLSIDPGLITLLTIAPRTGSVTAVPVVSGASTRSRAAADVCTLNGNCAPPGTLYLSVACAGSGALTVSIDDTPWLDSACDELTDSTVRVAWPSAQADTASATVSAAASTHWSLRIEQLVAQE